MSGRAAIVCAAILYANFLSAETAGPEPIRACGTDYYFTVTPPPGWAYAAEHPAAQLALTFTPPDKGATGTSITLGLGRVSFGDDFDLDEVSENGVAALAARGSPKAIRDGAVRHPSLPTRSAILEFPELSTYRVVVDVQSGRGYAMAATLTHAGGAPPADEIELFEHTVASLRYDAGRICEPGPDGSTREQAEAPHAVREARSPDDGPEPTPGQRALRRALSGGAMLEQLFVPIQMEPGMLGGSPVLLVIFDEGDERSPEQLLETFRERVAVTYCWAAKAHPLPQLAFLARERQANKASARTTSPIRLYSCKKRDFGKSHPVEDFRLDFSVADNL